MVDPEYVAAQAVARRTAPAPGRWHEVDQADRADFADKAAGIALADLMRRRQVIAADRRRQLLQAVERLRG